MAGKAKSEAEAKFIVEVVQHVLASNFPDVTMDQKAALMIPLITLMPKMKTPEMRAFIVSVFDSQMNASMAYKLAKGVAEVFMAFVGTLGDFGDVTEHLFEGEVDARVGKHFAKLLPHIDIDTWTSAGAGYYVALGLEHVGAYLDTLPAGPERNREEARIVAFAEGIVNDFNGRSDTLRKAASVALNTIAQKTTDPNVMRGQSYLDALPKVGGIDLDALD
jgi:hypothetical protein